MSVDVCFNFTGSDASFIVPADVTSINAKVLGAAGGRLQDTGVGGVGGYLEVNISVNPSDVLNIYVGGQNGYNGGGGVNGDAPGGGGGGASDIRKSGTSLANRIVVAGGGGGGGGGDAGGGAGGGAGINGVAGVAGTGGGGGTSSAGGAGGVASGPSAAGGNGVLGGGGLGSEYGGGGGGGFYGGGGGGYNGGGGGGSAYYDGSGVTLVNSSWTPVNTGNGLVIISYTSGPVPPVPPVPCFLEGTKILTESGYIPVQDLEKGTLIETYKHGLLPLGALGHSKIYNPGSDKRFGNRLFKLDKDNYPELEEDLMITGNHSILVDSLENKTKESLFTQFANKGLNKEVENKLNEFLERNYSEIYAIDDKYGLMAHMDPKAEPYTEEGTFNIWHLALESPDGDDTRNYGIYANGLLVEACSKSFLVEKSGMELVE